MKKQGKFIALVGGEGSGKGTIVAHLKKVLAGENVLFTREPGGTSLGNKIRDLLLYESMSTAAELLLFEAARAEHVAQVIAPSLTRGTHVISDRFDACTWAYQITGRWHGKHADFFHLVNKEVVGKYTPDLYVFCDISPKIAVNRRLTAGGEVTKFDKEAQIFHEAVYRGYKKFLSDKPHVSIDSTTDISTMTHAAEAVVRTTLGL